MKNKSNIRLLPCLLCLLAIIFCLPSLAAAEQISGDEIITEDAASIQERIDAVLDSFGITDDMTDDEIAYAIIAAEGDTIETAAKEIDAIDADAEAQLTEADLLTLELKLYERFRNIFDPLITAIPAVAVTGASGVDVSVDSNGSISESGGTVSVSVEGSFLSKKTTTITIQNTSGSTATISFAFSASNYNEFSLSSQSSPYSVTLQDDATFAFTLQSKSGLGNRNATLTLSNFSVVAAAANPNVTVTYGNLGSVKIDGTTVASGSVNSVSSASGASFVAVPGSGNKFLAWINPSTNAVISTSATYQLIPTEDMTIRAVFTNASSAPMFWANGTALLYESFDAAISYASSASNKVITLASDATLASGTYTIPAGVTLLIPFDSANTLYKEKPGAFAYDVNTQNFGTFGASVYRTLTMASGANITVNGAISVSAQHSASYGSNGSPIKNYGHIKMNSGSKITVESGAFLYAWGYITGSGSVEIKSGGTVYEPFQIADFRGGDATTQITNKADTYGVFPFNQYYMQNVEVPMTLHAGAKEYGYTSVNVTGAGIQSSPVPFFGSTTEKPMFIIDSGYVVKDYLENTGRTEIKIYGNVFVSSITISLKVSLIGTVTIDSSKYALPIPHHFTVSVESGTTSLNQNVAFYPGSELYVREGATCTLADGQSIFVYDLDQWLYNDGANGYSGTNNLPYVNCHYAPGGKGTTGRLKDALIQIDGTVDASAGAVYVTAGGANIYSTGTGVVKVNPANCTETITHQVITNGTDVGSWPEISIQPAILQDGDGTDVSTATIANGGYGEGEYEYCAATQKWCSPGHRYGDGVVTAPTCTTAGYTTHTCIACGNSYTGNEVAATGHTEVTDAAVDATCTSTGLTAGKHCSVCGTVTVAQQVVPTLAHTEVIDAAVAATCTTAGKTEGKHCSVCGEVIVAQEEIPALGHSWGTWSTGACSVCGEKAIKYAAVNLSIEGEILLNFKYYIHADAIKVGIKATVTEEGNAIIGPDGNTWTETISDSFKDNDGVRYVISQGIAAGEMTGDVTVAFKIGDVTVPIFDNDDLTADPVNSMTKTVTDFANIVLATNDSSRKALEELKEMCRKAVTFGGYAQKFYGTDKDNPAYSILDDTVPDVSSADTKLNEVSPTSRSGDNGVTATTQKLNLDSKIYIRTYFTLPDGKTASDFSVTITGPTNNGSGTFIDTTQTLVKDDGDDRWYVDILNVPPAYWNDPYTITITGNGSDYTVETSVLAWCARCVASNTASEAQKNMARAMYFYNVAADEYFTAKNAT